jgi:hypothetical protein
VSVEEGSEDGYECGAVNLIIEDIKSLHYPICFLPRNLGWPGNLFRFIVYFLAFKKTHHGPLLNSRALVRTLTVTVPASQLVVNFCSILNSLQSSVTIAPCATDKSISLSL